MTGDQQKEILLWIEKIAGGADDGSGCNRLGQVLMQVREESCAREQSK